LLIPGNGLDGRGDRQVVENRAGARVVSFGGTEGDISKICDAVDDVVVWEDQGFGKQVGRVKNAMIVKHSIAIAGHQNRRIERIAVKPNSRSVLNSHRVVVDREPPDPRIDVAGVPPVLAPDVQVLFVWRKYEIAKTFPRIISAHLSPVAEVHDVQRGRPRGVKPVNPVAEAGLDVVMGPRVPRRRKGSGLGHGETVQIHSRDSVVPEMDHIQKLAGRIDVHVGRRGAQWHLGEECAIGRVQGHQAAGPPALCAGVQRVNPGPQIIRQQLHNRTARQII
jgi:hypothetical protein